MGHRRGTLWRLLLLVVAVGLLWTTLVAAGAEAPPEGDASAAPEGTTELEAPAAGGETDTTDKVRARAEAPSAPAEDEPVEESPVEVQPVEEAPDAPPTPAADDAPAPAGKERAVDPGGEEPAAAAGAAAVDEAPAAAEQAVEEDPAPAAAEPAPAGKERATPREDEAAAPAAPAPARAVARLTTITTTKSTDPPRASQSFPFSLTGPSFSDSFSLVHGASHSSVVPGAGSYTLTETVPGGWKVVDIDCTNGSVKQTSGGSASITISVAAGEQWTCTVTDRQLATIVVAKSVDFDDGTAFEFTGDLGSFTIDPAGLSGSKTFSDLDPDQEYTITETVPAGWDLTGITCDNKQSSDSGTITVDPAPGQAITCTFSNAAQDGSITVLKFADPVDGTVFEFGGDLGGFRLVAEDDTPPDPGGPPDDRSAHAASFDVAPGTYTIVEDVPEGWKLRSAQCTAGTTGGSNGGGSGRAAPANGVEAVVGPGADVTCTFGNVELARLTIIKDADPDDGTEFPVTVSFETPGDPSGTPVGTFSLAHGVSVTLDAIEPGRYTIAEKLPTGWGLAGADCVPGPPTTPGTIVVEIAGGADVTCTLRNVRVAEITIAKRATVADGTAFPFSGDLGAFFVRVGPDGPGDPELRLMAREDGEGPATPTADGSITFTVDPGTYLVTEGDVAGWQLVDIGCDGGSVDTGEFRPPAPRAVPANSVEITVVAGDTVKCTFVNEAQPGSLTIVKEAKPADGTAFPFTYEPGSEAEERFELADGEAKTIDGLIPGLHRVVEDAPDPWGVGEIDCGDAEAAVDAAAGAVDVQIRPGADVTCVFRNTTTATITIVKEADPADGTDFHFTGDLGEFSLDVGPALPDEPGGDEGEPGSGPPPQPRETETALPDRMTFEVAGGSYTVSELETEHWDLRGIGCGPGEPPPPPGPAPRAAGFAVDLAKRSVTIDVAPGDGIVCVFSNVAEAVPVTIVKQTSPPSGESFRFDLSAQGQVQSADVRAGDSQTVFVDVGELTITELIPPGWGLRSVECTSPAIVDPAAGTATLTLVPGRAETCTFTNAKTALVTITKVAAPQAATEFGFSGDFGPFTLVAAGPPPEQPPGDGGPEVQGSALVPRQTSEEGEPARNSRTFEVDPGTYGVSEDATPGWELAAIACEGFPTAPRPDLPTPRAAESAAAIDLGNRGVELTVQPGDVVECNFENRQVARGLTIVKKSLPADGTDFGFTISQGVSRSESFRLDDDADPALSNLESFELGGAPATVTEQPAAGWDLVSIDCDVEGAKVDLAARSVTVELPDGAAATCTFTNRRRGSVTVIKDATPADGTDFPFVLAGAGGEQRFTLDDGADADRFTDRITLSDLLPGTYTLTEELPRGWVLRDVSCTGSGAIEQSGATVKFELAPGGGVVCTFRDVRTGTIEGSLFLDFDGDGVQGEREPDLADVRVQALWAGFDGNFGTGDDQTFTTASRAGNSYTLADLPPGSYRVTVDPASAPRLGLTTASSFAAEVRAGETTKGLAFGFAGADLELTITPSTRSVQATVPFEVRVTLVNRGPLSPSGVAVQLTVPPSLRFERAVGDGAYDPRTGRWELGDVPAGATRTLTLTLTPTRAGESVQVLGEVVASSLADPDSTPANAAAGEDDQAATDAFTVAVAPAEILPVTGLRQGEAAPYGAWLVFAGALLVLAARLGRRWRDDLEAAGRP